MLRELVVDLDAGTVSAVGGDPGVYGKALAVRRLCEAEDANRTVYLTGYTPLAAAGLGFAGKLNLYGVSLLGGNLQGSRSGGLAAAYLTRLGIVGIRVSGDSSAPVILHVAENADAALVPLTQYGATPCGTAALAKRLYTEHGSNLALGVTDPASTGFLYNAVVCNSRPGSAPNRTAARSTTRFGRNNLLGIAVARAPAPLHPPDCDRRAVAALLRRIHNRKRNPNLIGSTDPQAPLLGGTYGAAAKARLDNGHGLTNLFRNARVPGSVYDSLLPSSMVRRQLELAARGGLKITRRPCLPGCPNRCIQTTLIQGPDGAVRVAKAGEWETVHGVINLGLFDGALATSATILAHSNEFAYDHIEALVALAALALATEHGPDTGVRYGDRASILGALDQAVAGNTDLGQLLRRGAAAVEEHYGLERHFTVGGHALPFHNGRSLLQTGTGLVWTYGRHGESCAGPGRHNFLGQPYDPADHDLDPRLHVLNTIHGMIMYGALDEHGMCFFMGPSVDTLVDVETLERAMGLEANAGAMVRAAAGTIANVHDFNSRRGIRIRPLPRVFLEQATYGNAQTSEQGVVFNVPFPVIRDYGRQVLDEAASGQVTIPETILDASRRRYR